MPSILTFPATDTNGMAKRLKLKDRAKEQGFQDLPPADAEGLDPIEHEIIGEFERMAKEQFDLYLEQQKVYTERAADMDVSGRVLQISNVVEDAITNLEREANTGRDELYAKKRAVVDTGRELEKFKQRHGLDRPPRNYDTKARKVKSGALVLLIAIEAILNGFFLSKGSQFGLLGGILEAMIIAGVNIAIGFSVGLYVVRGLAHKHWGFRISAAMGTLVYLGIAFGFNLAVAHYRTAITGDPFEAPLIAYQHLVAGPFAIEDLESWLLFVMGFLFSLFAAGDGWWMDDPYPGYGSTMRRNLEALDDFTDLKQELFGELDEIKGTAETEIDDLAHQIEARQGELKTILMRSRTLKSAMDEHFQHLQSAGNKLLSIYRVENVKHREARAPVRFHDGSVWKLNFPPTNGTAVSDAGADKLRGSVADAFRKIPSHRSKLHAAYRKAMEEYARIEALVEERVASS